MTGVLGMSANLFAEFWRDERGSSAVEFAIWSLLLGAWLAFSTAIFIAWDNRADSAKAAYAISDIISRQDLVEVGFLDQMFDLSHQLVNNPSGSNNLRVSSIIAVQDPNDPAETVLQVEWSCALTARQDPTGGGFFALTDAEIPAPIIPEMPLLDTIILTEFYVPYSAISAQVVPGSLEWANQIVTQPRQNIRSIGLCQSARDADGPRCAGIVDTSC